MMHILVLKKLEHLAGIVGKAGLTPIDLNYMNFGDEFEKKFLSQAVDEDRTIEETLGLQWKCNLKTSKE